MKNKTYKMIGKRILGIVLATQLIALTALTGCGNAQDNNTSEAPKATEEAKSSVVMTVNDFEVTQQIFNLYVMQYLYVTKTNTSNLSLDGIKAIQSAAIEQIKLEVVEYLLAKITDGIEVKDEDLEEAKSKADSLYEFYGEEFLSQYGIDYDCVKDLYERQVYISALKDKALADMTQTYTETYTEKYKDMKYHSVYFAFFPTIQYDEDGKAVEDEEGNTVAVTDDEKEEQLTKANELCDRAKAGETLEDLVKEYKIEDYSGIERDYEGAYSEELNAVLSKLAEGDISDVVTTDAGYMVVRMDNTDDKEYKEYMIDSIAGQLAEDSYTSMQTNWLTAAGADKVVADQSVMDQLDIIALGQLMHSKCMY